MTTLITIGPPTSNGDLHLGHLAGPYVAADIYRRHLAEAGEDSLLVCGSDDHQSYVSLKSQQRQCTERELVSRATADIVSTLEAADVEMTHYSSPHSSDVYKSCIRAFFVKLYEDGHLVEMAMPRLVCSDCDGEMYEAFVRGHCNHCNSPSDGGICENCGRPNANHDLIDPLCAVCGGTGRIVEDEANKMLVFPLERFHDRLAAYHRTLKLPPKADELCRSMLARELPDIPVMHSGPWGIDVPIEGYRDWKISAWFELGPFYLGTLDDYCRRTGNEKSWRDYWNRNNRIVQFFGFDSVYFHSILFAAQFMAYDPDMALPEAFVVNEFYRLDGSKFSTSRNHAVWGRDFLAEQPTDLVRLYMSLTRPENEQTNFTRPEYLAFVEREVHGKWLPWLAGLESDAAALLASDDTGGPALSESDSNFLARQRARERDIVEGLAAEGFSLQAAAGALCRMLAESHERLRAQPEIGPAAAATTIEAAAIIARCAAPIMPGFAAALQALIDMLRRPGPGREELAGGIDTIRQTLLRRDGAPVSDRPAPDRDVPQKAAAR